MKLPTDPGSLKSLDERLKRARQKMEEAEQPKVGGLTSSLMGAAWRLMIELAVAPVASGAFGWWLDKTFGTEPWCLLIFLLLGLLAGGLNAYRTTQRFGRDSAEPKQSDEGRRKNDPSGDPDAGLN